MYSIISVVIIAGPPRYKVALFRCKSRILLICETKVALKADSLSLSSLILLLMVVSSLWSSVLSSNAIGSFDLSISKILYLSDIKASYSLLPCKTICIAVVEPSLLMIKSR